MRTSKVADALDRVELKLLRRQLQAFPEDLKEQARNNFLIAEDIKQRDLQDFQMTMIGRLESLLKKRLMEDHVDYRKFKIGGHEKGVYERFFRIEPSVHMSKPQFAMALYRCFGDELKQSEGAVSKMYDSFDPRGRNEMDWRCFLLLLLVTMQPDLTFREYLRWAYAVYASSGSLDLQCQDAVSVGELKELICVPVYLVMKCDIKAAFDRAWAELAVADPRAAQLIQEHNSRSLIHGNGGGDDRDGGGKGSKGPGGGKGKGGADGGGGGGGGVDPDKCKIPYALFDKLLQETSFNRFTLVAKPFGSRDLRPWTYVMEESYYHPILLARMKQIRREGRNEDEVRKFQHMILLRTKRKCTSMWKGYVARRQRVRYLIIQTAIRWKCDQIGALFDIWKDVAISENASAAIGKMVRGYIGRKRAVFMKQMQTRTLKVQSAARQLFNKLQYKQVLARRAWAATTVQRHYRGYMGRLRVKTLVEALYDVGKRNLAIKKRKWAESRRQKAATRLQMCYRRMRIKRAIKERIKAKVQAEYVGYEMDLQEHKRLVEREVYRQQLSQWFKERKVDYDKERASEEHTLEEKRKVIAYRNRAALLEKEEKERVKEARMEREEEKRIEGWLKAFEERKVTRTKQKEQQCRRCLLVCETPEELELKSYILEKAKKHVKTVLRRADKQKIPMEIPEAREIAVDEIIQQLVEEELAAVQEEGRKEAEDYAKNQELKEAEAKAKLEKERKRKRKWAACAIQGLFRGFAARRELRRRAYARYQKHFDEQSMLYYYFDTRTKRARWDKPSSLGFYDVQPADYWMAMHDPLGDLYFYHPKSWAMQYDQPSGTVLCEGCRHAFAVLRLQINKRMLCENCTNGEVNDMMYNRGILPVDIAFKPFDGNKVTASQAQFAAIKQVTWQEYLLKTNAALSGASGGGGGLAALGMMESGDSDDDGSLEGASPAKLKTLMKKGAEGAADAETQAKNAELEKKRKAIIDKMKQEKAAKEAAAAHAYAMVGRSASKSPAPSEAGGSLKLPSIFKGKKGTAGGGIDEEEEDAGAESDGSAQKKRRKKKKAADGSGTKKKTKKKKKRVAFADGGVSSDGGATSGAESSAAGGLSSGGEESDASPGGGGKKKKKKRLQKYDKEGNPMKFVRRVQPDGSVVEKWVKRKKRPPAEGEQQQQQSPQLPSTKSEYGMAVHAYTESGDINALAGQLGDGLGLGPDSGSTVSHNASSVSLPGIVAPSLKEPPVLRPQRVEAEEDQTIVVDEMCAKCKLVAARVQCNMCMTYFCEPCFHSNHRKPPWTAHSFIEVNKHLYSRPNSKGSTGSGGGGLGSKPGSREAGMAGGIMSGVDEFAPT